MTRTEADLEEDHDDEDGVADGEDPPQHAHSFRVPHELRQENIIYWIFVFSNVWSIVSCQQSFFLSSNVIFTDIISPH